MSAKTTPALFLWLVTLTFETFWPQKQKWVSRTHRGASLVIPASSVFQTSYAENRHTEKPLWKPYLCFPLRHTVYCLYRTRVGPRKHVLSETYTDKLGLFCCLAIKHCVQMPGVALDYSTTAVWEPTNFHSHTHLYHVLGVLNGLPVDLKMLKSLSSRSSVVRQSETTYRTGVASAE